MMPAPSTTRSRGLLARLLRDVPAALFDAGDRYGRTAPRGASAVGIRWLGTAGFVVETADRVLALDPFVTRPDLRTLLTAPLVPDDALAARLVPRADDVLIGHAHYDHVLDAPSICVRTGARFIGSRSACNVARAGGVPEARILETEGGDDIACGTSVVARAYPTIHGRVYGVRPLQGEIPRPPAWPPRNRALRCGTVLNWHLRIDRPDAEPLRILHVDTAEYPSDLLQGVQADVLCLCAIGRNYRPRYLEEIVEITSPRVIIPCHWDWLFDPIDAPPRQLPGVDLEGFAAAIERAKVRPVVLPLDGTFFPDW